MFAMAEPVATSQTPPMSLVPRLVRVVVSPRAAYAAVAARPNWLGALATIIAVTASANFVFLSTTVGQNALLDRQLGVMQSFGQQVPDQAYQRMVSMLPRLRYFTAAGQVVSFPIAIAIVAGLLFSLFVAILGADGTFKQAYAVVVHSSAIIVLQQLFVLPLDYARQSMSSPTTLAVFLPMLDDTSFPARLLGSIDLFVIWWMVSLAIGLGVLYKRRTGPIAFGLLAVYAGIALIVAAIRSA
jgi:Yip1 domain